MAFEYDFFISYSGDDKPLARAIYDALSKHEIGRAPYKICLQDVDFKLGKSFTEAMERAMLGSRITIAVLTPNYFATSKYTRAEFDFAWQSDRLVIFQFGGAAIPPYVNSEANQSFDVRPGEAGFERLVRDAATLQPTAIGVKDCRVRLLDNMPRWKGEGGKLIGREDELQQLTDA